MNLLPPRASVRRTLWLCLAVVTPLFSGCDKGDDAKPSPTANRAPAAKPAPKAMGGGPNLEPWFTAVAFSPDGTEFAAFLVGVQVGLNAGEAMACWDVKTGRPVYYRSLDRAGHGMLTTPSPEPMQWFPDGKGWLLFNRYVVDRAAGAVTEAVKTDGDMFAHFGTKILEDRQVLAFSGGKMKPVPVKRTAGKTGP